MTEDFGGHSLHYPDDDSQGSQWTLFFFSFDEFTTDNTNKLVKSFSLLSIGAQESPRVRSFPVCMQEPIAARVKERLNSITHLGFYAPDHYEAGYHFFLRIARLMRDSVLPAALYSAAPLKSAASFARSRPKL